MGGGATRIERQRPAVDCRGLDEFALRAERRAVGDEI